MSSAQLKDTEFRMAIMQAMELESPGTVRVFSVDSRCNPLQFASVKAKKHADGTITVEDLDRSAIGRMALGPDILVTSETMRRAGEVVGTRMTVYPNRRPGNPFEGRSQIIEITDEGTAYYNGDRGAVSRWLGGPDLFVSTDRR